MKHFVSILALVVLAASAAFAQGEGGGETTLKGYVVDKHCASGTGDALTAKARDMAKSCPLSKPCLASGLGVVSDGKWYAFDAKGSTMAAKLLKKSKAEKGVMVEVTGTVDGDALTVSSIEEVKRGE